MLYTLYVCRAYRDGTFQHGQIKGLTLTQAQLGKSVAAGRFNSFAYFMPSRVQA